MTTDPTGAVTLETTEEERNQFPNMMGVHPGSFASRLLRDFDRLRSLAFPAGEREKLEMQWARMIEAHRRSALRWEESARELDAALVAATGCEARYDHDRDDEEEIAF